MAQNANEPARRHQFSVDGLEARHKATHCTKRKRPQVPSEAGDNLRPLDMHIRAVTVSEMWTRRDKEGHDRAAKQPGTTKNSSRQAVESETHLKATEPQSCSWSQVRVGVAGRSRVSAGKVHAQSALNVDLMPINKCKRSLQIINVSALCAAARGQLGVSICASPDTDSSCVSPKKDGKKWNFN